MSHIKRDDPELVNVDCTSANAQSSQSGAVLYILEEKLSSNQDGQEDEIPKAGLERTAADPRGSRTCVCSSTLLLQGAHTGGRKANYRPAVVPSSRRG